MFSIGDTVFYEEHGVCEIVDIKEQTFGGKTQNYYILESHQNDSLRLYHLVDSKHSKLAAIASKDIVTEILDTFKQPADEWSERAPERSKHYRAVIETNDPLQIAQMVNTILRKEIDLIAENKKLYSQEDQVLKRVFPNLCNEISFRLKISEKKVEKQIRQNIKDTLESTSS